MPRATVGDTSLTRSYIPKVSQTSGIAPFIAHFYKPIEDRCIHEGRVVDQLYYTSDHTDSEQQYNLAYFFVKRIESARATLKAHLPYVMRPLALRQTRRPRSDRGKARHSISSTSAHHNRGSSSHQGDDDEDDGASRASTPSPTTYLNFLKPLNCQPYQIPSPSQQDDDLLFERQIELLNQSQEIHKEVRGGFKSFRKVLRGVFGKKKKYGYIKNHKKTIKNGQARTRERKSEQKPKVKVNLGQASVKEKVNQGASLNQGSKRAIQELVNKMAGIDQSNQRISLAHSQAQATCDEEKAQRGMGFALNTLSKQTQLSLKRIATLAIRVSSIFDLTVEKWISMIE
ncbi:hypothetical protein Tco_0441996 [Tanacetum coccineum]